MKDIQIRRALKQKDLSRFSNDPQTLILDELGVSHGATRIDIAVINSSLIGYELKSDYDTLNRLPYQANMYNAVFDRVTLVVGYKHAYEALKIVPEWWGVKLVYSGKRGGIHFTTARNPRNNPSQDLLSLAKLLWKDEALKLLMEFNADKEVQYKPRSFIYLKISEVVSLNYLRFWVCQQLKSRTNWRSETKQHLYDD